MIRRAILARLVPRRLYLLYGLTLVFRKSLKAFGHGIRVKVRKHMVVDGARRMPALDFATLSEHAHAVHVIIVLRIAEIGIYTPISRMIKQWCRALSLEFAERSRAQRFGGNGHERICDRARRAFRFAELIR